MQPATTQTVFRETEKSGLQSVSPVTQPVTQARLRQSQRLSLSQWPVQTLAQTRPDQPDPRAAQSHSSPFRIDENRIDKCRLGECA